MFLLDLPLSLIGYVLSEWVETRDLGALDSALCCKHYRHLYLEALRDRSVVSLGYPSRDIDDSHLIWLFSRRVKVQSLSISDPDVNLSTAECEVFAQLEYLDIYFRNRLRLIGDACRDKLKVLILRGCEVNLDDSLRMMSQFSSLHTLEIAELTKYMGGRKTKSSTSAHGLPNQHIACASTLKTFVCNWSNLGSHVVQHIARTCTGITRMELSVTGLTDEALYTIVNFCSKIKTLRLIRCESTTPDGIVFLAALRGLQVLDLNGTSGVVNESVIPIVVNNPDLASINLRHANAINSLAVMKIASSCPGLTALDVSYCTFVKDDAIALLANRCSNLRDLQLCGCECITDMSMLRLANMCSHLTSINIKDCMYVTRITLDAFAFHGVKLYKKKLR